MARSREEHLTQVAFVQWCAWNKKKYPALDLGYAIANGGARNVIVGAMLKKEGVRKGVPDWCLPVPSKGFGALYIEFKAKKGIVRTEQFDFLRLLTEYGNKAAICRSCDEAANVVKEYLDDV
jgi:hypothetical protein